MWETVNFCITIIMASALLDIRTHGSYILLNRKLASNNDAKENCSAENGRLLRYDNIARSDSAARIEYLLDNGQSVWVDGYASFAPPVAYRGCYENTHVYSYPDERFDNNSLYICANHCTNHPSYKEFRTDYIGLTDVGCYCLKERNVNISMRSVSESLCNNKCNQAYANIDSCGGQDKISVHRLFTEEPINWADSEYLHEQCTFVKLKDNGTSLEVFTASCYTIGESVRVSGFFCKSGEHSQLSRDCSVKVSNNSERFCVENSSSTWEEARNVCLNYKGLLADLKSVERLSPLMADNTGYWLGIYKPFIANDKRIDQKTVCLAATKYNNRLFLEPDNCRREKAYLCETSSIPPTISKKDMSSSYTSQTTPTLETQATEGKNRDTWETTLENSQITATSPPSTSSPNNLSKLVITNEPTSSTKHNYSTPSEVMLENAEITTTSSLGTPSLNNMDTSMFTNEPSRNTPSPTEDDYSTLHKANVTTSKYSKINENMTSASVGLIEPSGQPRSGLNPFDANNFFAVAAVAFVAALAVIAVGIVVWVVKRKCHKKSHKRCHKQTHSSTTPSNIPATSAVGNDEPEAYCITGEESVFRIAMDPNQNSFSGATADQAQFAAQGKASSTINCTDTHQYQNEGSLRLKQIETYDRLKFKYLNIKYLYEDSSIHIYDHSCSNNAGLKNKNITDRAIDKH